VQEAPLVFCLNVFRLNSGSSGGSFLLRLWEIPASDFRNTINRICDWWECVTESVPLLHSHLFLFQLFNLLSKGVKCV